MPYQTATNPDTGEKLINVDGAWKPVEQSATHSDTGEKAYKVDGKWMTGEPGASAKPPAAAAQAPAPKEEKQPANDDASSEIPGALIEPALHYASQAAALPVAAGASLYQLATAPSGTKAKAASEASQKVQEAMTYEPRTQAGKAVSGAIDAVGSIPGKVANWATDGIADNETVKKVLGAKGSEYLQAGLNTAIQAIPAVLGVKGAKGTAAPATAEAAAESFVRGKTKLDWDKTPQVVKDKLTDLAKNDPTALDRIKPAAVERQARFEKYDVPASKGQIERDRHQLTKEENLARQKDSSTERINDAQDERFHEILDDEVKKIGPSPKADTRGGVGDSVQGALGGSAKGSAKNYGKLFDTARATEPDAEVSASPLLTLLQQKPHVQNLDFVKTWLAKADLERAVPGTPGTKGIPAGKVLDANGKPLIAGKPGTPGTPATTQLRGLKLNELHDLRSDAAAIAAKPGAGKEGYYASQVVKAIDKSMEQVPPAAKAWKAAIDAFRTHKEEFNDQGRVRALISNKRGAKGDPQVAREDVFQHSIISGSAKNVSQIKTSLLKAGDKGVQAWKDLQAETIRHLQDKASGKREIETSEGNRQFNSPFLDAFKELDKDGKIDVIFDKDTAGRLRDVAKMVHDARTRPGKAASGSDTVPRALALTAGEKMSLFPGGHYIRGVGNLIESVHKQASKSRENAKAKMSNLDEAHRRASKEVARSYTLRNYRRGIAAGTTVQPQDNDKDNE